MFLWHVMWDRIHLHVHSYLHKNPAFQFSDGHYTAQGQENKKILSFTPKYKDIYKIITV